jgi:hypothetical protein
MEKIPYYRPLSKIFREFYSDAGLRLVAKLEEDLEKEHKNILKLFLTDLDAYFKSKNLDDLLAKESKLFSKHASSGGYALPVAKALTRLYAMTVSFYFVKKLQEDSNFKKFALGSPLYREYLTDALFNILAIARLLELEKLGSFYLPQDEKSVILARMMYFSPFLFFSKLFGKDKEQEFYVFFKIVKHYRYLTELHLEAKSRQEILRMLETMLPGSLE